MIIRVLEDDDISDLEQVVGSSLDRTKYKFLGLGMPYPTGYQSAAYMVWSDEEKKGDCWAPHGLLCTVKGEDEMVAAHEFKRRWANGEFE